MKILKSGVLPVSFVGKCSTCDTIIEADGNDITMITGGRYYECPLCGEKIWLFDTKSDRGMSIMHNNGLGYMLDKPNKTR